MGHVLLMIFRSIHSKGPIPWMSWSSMISGTLIMLLIWMPEIHILFNIVFVVAMSLIMCEFYFAIEYRKFSNIYAHMIDLNEPEFSEYRALTEQERDGVIGDMVNLSDGMWTRYLLYCKELNSIRFEEMDKGIIKDIEMLRAMK